jgi:putative DNA primase/helicase
VPDAPAGERLMSHIGKHIAAVARLLLGEPNAKHSTATELRYGSRGSLSVDLKKGVWHDHEKGNGGGVLDLIERETGLANGAAVEWLRRKGFDVGDDAGPDTSTVTGAGQKRIAATYSYHDETGALLFEVVRFEPKDSRQRRPDPSRPDGWAWNLGDTRRVPYRRPELLETSEDAVVLFVEGEKDADRLASVGLLATSSPQGAGKWRDEIRRPADRHPPRGDPR